jgi:alpha-glucosidase
MEVFMINLDNLTKTSRFMLYVQNMRAILRKEMLFSDSTGEYLIPQEPEPLDIVKIRFRTAVDNADTVYLRLHDISIEMKMVKRTTMFDYYEAEIQIGKKRVDYYFEVNNGFERCYYDKIGSSDGDRQEYPFTIVPGFKTPTWAKGAVMYQIFVDRFYNGDKSNDVLDREYTYIGEYTKRVTEWSKYPATMGVREFYGGDLSGVIQKLDYLKELGIDAIYFNPLFVSPSNHKYDIQDYDYIDPHYGKIIYDEGEVLNEGILDNKLAKKYINRVTDKKNLEESNKLLIELVNRAHELGMKVIIDGVFNHCGSFNKWLDREGIYSMSNDYEEGAFVSKDSPYVKFFKFHDRATERWPNNKTYEGWWGYETLPKLNYEESEKLEEYILAIGRKWVSEPYNVDGWRLDVAADLGQTPEYNHSFWKRFRNEVKKANPEALILAEHYGDPTPWIQGDEWDTVMNYDAFMEPVTWFLTGMEKHSDDKNEMLIGDGQWFFRTMKYNMVKFHSQSLMVAMNQLSNHDHSRFLTRTNGVVGRIAVYGPEAAGENVSKAIFKAAVVIQMTWMGAPTIYYGDEAGVCGWTDPDNRRTYPWGKEDKDLIKFHKEMIRIHKENVAILKGSFIPLCQEKDLIAYGRFYKKNKVIVVVNTSKEEKSLSLSTFSIGIDNGGMIQRIMETEEDRFSVFKDTYKVKNGKVNLKLKPLSATVYVGEGNEELIYSYNRNWE